MTAEVSYPSDSEIDQLVAKALATDTTIVQEALVTALARYLEITGTYVRSGRSSDVMEMAFHAGVMAIRYAAGDGFIRESTKSDGAAQS